MMPPLRVVAAMQAHRSGRQQSGWSGPPRFHPERVTHRYNTLIDAFNTADRKQRVTSRMIESGDLRAVLSQLGWSAAGEELTGFVEKFARHAGDGTIVVEYPRLADALRKRDLEMMAKAEARALRQTGAGGGGLSFHTPERPSPGGGGGASGGGRLPYNPLSRGGGVAAALRMVDEQTNQTSPPRPAMQGDARTSSASAVRRSRGHGWTGRAAAGRCGEGAWRRRPSGLRTERHQPVYGAAPSSRRRSNRGRLYARRLPGVATDCHRCRACSTSARPPQVRSRSSFAPASTRTRSAGAGCTGHSSSRAVACKASPSLPPCSAR